MSKKCDDCRLNIKDSYYVCECMRCICDDCAENFGFECQKCNKKLKKNIQENKEEKKKNDYDNPVVNSNIENQIALETMKINQNEKKDKIHGSVIVQENPKENVISPLLHSQIFTPNKDISLMKQGKYSVFCPKHQDRYNFIICQGCETKDNCTICFKNTQHLTKCPLTFNKNAIEQFKENIHTYREKLKEIQNSFEKQSDSIYISTVAYLDSVYTMQKKIIGKKKENFKLENEKEIESKIAKINELIQNIKKSASNYEKDIVKGMNETFTYVDNNKQNLEDLIDKKLIYKPTLEDKLGLNELVPKTFRKEFIIIFKEDHSDIINKFFMFNEQYNIRISYLVNNNKYSVYVKKENENVKQQPEEMEDKIPEDYLMLNFSFVLKRENFKISNSDQCKKNAIEFGFKYFCTEDKVKKNTPYKLKLKVNYSNYFSKCNAENCNYFKYEIVKKK